MSQQQQQQQYDQDEPGRSDPATPRERAASSRASRAAAGEPLVQDFDRALRAEILSRYTAGDIDVSIPDVIGAVLAGLISHGFSRRGCAALLRRLQERVEREGRR